MHLSNPTRKLTTGALPNTWDTIHRLELTLGLSETDLLEMLCLTRNEFERARASKKDLPADKIFSLAERLELGFNSIVNGKIDYQALSQHYFGNKCFLPKRYERAALSRRRTTMFILNYVEEAFGWKERLNILRQFQLNESLFADPDKPISILFASDLSEYLLRYKLDESQLATIGAECLKRVQADPVRAELRDCTSVGEIYERMCDGLIVKYFEKNFEYQMLELNDEYCVIAGRPSTLLLDALESKKVGNTATNIVRGGLASGYPTLLGLPSATAKHVEKSVKGSTEIHYRFDYSQANFALKKARMQFLDFPKLSH